MTSASTKETATAFSARSLRDFYHKTISIQHISIQLTNRVIGISVILRYENSSEVIID
jgi:hypothetical protein